MVWYHYGMLYLHGTGAFSNFSVFTKLPKISLIILQQKIVGGLYSAVVGVYMYCNLNYRYIILDVHFS